MTKEQINHYNHLILELDRLKERRRKDEGMLDALSSEICKVETKIVVFHQELGGKSNIDLFEDEGFDVPSIKTLYTVQLESLKKSIEEIEKQIKEI